MILFYEQMDARQREIFEGFVRDVYSRVGDKIEAYVTDRNKDETMRMILCVHAAILISPTPLVDRVSKEEYDLRYNEQIERAMDTIENEYLKTH